MTDIEQFLHVPSSKNKWRRGFIVREDGAEVLATCTFSHPVDSCSLALWVHSRRKDSDRNVEEFWQTMFGLRSHTIGTKSNETRDETDKYKREEKQQPKVSGQSSSNDDFYETPNNAHVCGCDLKILDTVDSIQQVGIATL